MFDSPPAPRGALLAPAAEEGELGSVEVPAQDEFDPATVKNRLANAVRQHHAALWRDARRLGVPAEAVDDVVQEVFIIAGRKLTEVAIRNERAYLFAITLRVASNHRQRARARRELSDERLGERQADATPSAELLLDQKRLRLVLDEILDELPVGLRAVFVLSEIDELSLQQIAELIAAPVGTVASRVRRARELFAAASKRVRARYRLDGGQNR